MRVRTPFAAAFGVTLLGSAYLGLGPKANPTPVNDKALHFMAFFVLSLTGYWTVETSRRTLMKIVSAASIAVGVASEFAQGIINPARGFDPMDIAANLLGSFAAIALCSWYHKRMLDRKRRQKMQGYVVTSDDVADIELGEDVGLGEHDGLDEASQEEDDEGADAWDNMDDNLEEAADEQANGDATKKSAD